jgi:hypothetical protein
VTNDVSINTEQDEVRFCSYVNIYQLAPCSYSLTVPSSRTSTMQKHHMHATSQHSGDLSVWTAGFLKSYVLQSLLYWFLPIRVTGFLVHTGLIHLMVRPEGRSGTMKEGRWNPGCQYCPRVWVKDGGCRGKSHRRLGKTLESALQPIEHAM